MHPDSQWRCESATRCVGGRPANRRDEWGEVGLVAIVYEGRCESAMWCVLYKHVVTASIVIGKSGNNGSSNDGGGGSNDDGSSSRNFSAFAQPSSVVK